MKTTNAANVNIFLLCVIRMHKPWNKFNKPEAQH